MWTSVKIILHGTCDKTHAIEWRSIYGGGASSVTLRTRERAAHVASRMSAVNAGNNNFFL